MGFHLLVVTLDREAGGVISYLGPSVFGLGGAKLIETRYAVSVLWIATILLAVVIGGKWLVLRS